MYNKNNYNVGECNLVVVMYEFSCLSSYLVDLYTSVYMKLSLESGVVNISYESNYEE